LAQGFKEVLAHYFPWLHEVPKDHHISHGMSEDLNSVPSVTKAGREDPILHRCKGKTTIFRGFFCFQILKLTAKLLI
jgi:hypothetical protein